VANGYLRPHTTTREEVKDLRSLVERDLADAAIQALSDDRRFATAYNAALQLSKIVVAVAGYRLAKGQSAHYNAFETVKIAIPTHEIDMLCDYFDRCRRKRNHIEYDGSDVVTNTETEEIRAKTAEYRDIVEKWIESTQPELKA
jgi:hypothetical protein